jgi:hypothetical protein
VCDVTAELLAVAAFADPSVGLPRGVTAVIRRAERAGFTVRPATYGQAEIEVSAREHLFDEDGSPLTTDKGRPRFRIVKRAVAGISVGLHLQHDEAQQGQCCWWVGEGSDVAFDEGWAWPSDGGDCRRRIGAPQVGTLVDLDLLREQSLAAAELAKAMPKPRLVTPVDFGRTPSWWSR